MATTFEKLLETSGMSEEVKAVIQEAWVSQISEAKETVAAELREEFAQKFQHDKNVLIESMDSFLKDRIHAEMADFAKDKQALVAERVAYKAKMREHIEQLNKFIVEQLSNEVKELRDDKVKMRENVAQLEDFLVAKLTEEIHTFREEKKALVEQRVMLVAEGKKHIAEAKTNFIKKAASLVESKVNSVLNKEIKQYRDDIVAARENDFGRRIFEAFAGEYLTSHLNEGSEISKMKKVLESKERELTESKSIIAEKEKLVEGVTRKLNVAQDKANRTKVLTGLLAPLGKDKRNVMEDLLKTVETSKLTEAFDKYLPAVLNETVKRPEHTSRKALTESFGKKQSNSALTEDNSTLAVDIKKLKAQAGIID